MFKPRSNQTAYVTFADSIQAPDRQRPATSRASSSPTPARRFRPTAARKCEMGYKVESQRMNFSADLFRIRRPFADVVEQLTDHCGYNAAASVSTGSARYLRKRPDRRPAGQLRRGSHALRQHHSQPEAHRRNHRADPKLTHTFVLLPAGNQYASPTCTDPDGRNRYRSDLSLLRDQQQDSCRHPRLQVQHPCRVSACRRCPRRYFNFDWQHVGRRPVDDINSYYVPQYNTFDLGGRYTAKVFGKSTTWLVTFNNVSNVHYWSTLGPGSITGQSTAAPRTLGRAALDHGFHAVRLLTEFPDCCYWNHIDRVRTCRSRVRTRICLPGHTTF